MTLTQILASFKGVTQFKSHKDKESHLSTEFARMAKEILYGGYFLIEGKEKLYVEDIEFYYHEEDDGGLKDPVMYHTCDHESNTNLPYFELGRLNLHISGVDVTFENSKLHYRASCLIRGFRMEGEPFDSHSTHIYDKMLYMGIPLGKPIEIEWRSEDLEGKQTYELQGEPRQNVAQYKLDNKGNYIKDNKGNYIKKEWIADSLNPIKEEHFKYGKHTFVQCPRKWRFRKNKHN